MPILRRLSLALLTLLTVVEISSAVVPQPAVVSGVIDLTAWNPVAQPVLSLDGDWKFGWNILADPSKTLSADAYFRVPDFWNDKKNSGTSLTAEGFATYALHIRRKSAREIFAIHAVDMESAYALYANGVLIGSNGKVGKSKAEEVPEWNPKVWTFAAEGDIDLILHVSNFHHRLGGIWQGFRFGPQDAVRALQNKAIALEVFLFGSFLMIAIYHLLIFFLRRNEREFLWLALFCVLIALRSVVTGERFILGVFPSLSWEWLLRLDYLTASLGLLVTHVYLSIVFRAYYHRLALYILLAVMVPAAAAELVLDPKIFSHLVPVHSLALILWSGYFLGVNFWAVLKKMPGSGVLLAGWVIGIAGCVHDTLYLESIVNSGYMFALGLYVFILTQSYYLALRYARAFSLSEVLARRMESLLTLTRDLNRSGKRDAAIWTAADEICRVTGATSEPTAYVRSHDTELFRKLLRDGTSESLSPEFSENLARASAPAVSETVLRIPIRYAEKTLCVLDILQAHRASGDVLRIQYLEGIFESLALALENIYSAERHALASVGQAASEIVHDINHHCQVVAHHARSARAGDLSQALDGIDRETILMKNLALDILDYAREKIVVHPRKNPLSEIEKTITSDLVELFAGKRIHFSLQRTAEGELSVDLERFRRVVLNLARNADLAMNHAGKFSVRIERQNDVCCFIFEDNGPGLDPKIQDRLFEPFASGGRGSGLGLAVVKRIVGAHGGAVHAGSESGKGCRFMVELPA